MYNIHTQQSKKYIEMTEESMLDNNLVSTSLLTNPYELELQSWCNHTLKNRLFQGFYLERRYVENIKGYRDVISLHKSENSFNKTLLDVLDKLRLFCSHQNSQKWIGITSGTLKGITTPLRQFMLDTYLWVDMKDLAFGHYWFSITTVRFHNNEIILRLKEIKHVEEEHDASNAGTDNAEEPADNVNFAQKSHVTLEHFKLLLQQWKESIKLTVYNFMSQDITKEKIKDALHFSCLTILSVSSLAFASLKYLGAFSLRFLQEVNRFIYVSTPIIIKLIDVFTQLVRALFIFFTMIWNDVLGDGRQRNRI